MNYGQISIRLMPFLICILLAGCSLARLSTGHKAEKYPDLRAKADELANYNASEKYGLEKLGLEERIKGKIAIVRKDKDAPRASLDRFSGDGEFSTAEPGQSAGFLPPEMYAKRPDEIETLIKLQCHDDTTFGTYGQPGSYSGETHEFKNVVCDVSLIDYKKATLLAKHTFGDHSAPSTIVTGTNKNGGFPGAEIQHYLMSLPNDVMSRALATPSGETLSPTQ